MQADLFGQARDRLELEPGAVVFQGGAVGVAAGLLADLAAMAVQAPFRCMEVPSGRRMSVAVTNSGALGWTSSRRGYRYAGMDPVTGAGWPELPAGWRALAADAAERAGFAGFAPDACLINRYQPGARVSLHQDRSEASMAFPVVTVSLGLPARFLWGGACREDRPRRILLQHGDIMVWGGPARLHYHGVDPIREGRHPLTGTCRYSLTFRRAGPTG